MNANDYYYEYKKDMHSSEKRVCVVDWNRCRSGCGQQEAGTEDDGGDHHRAAGAGPTGGDVHGGPGGQAGVHPEG